MRSGAVVRHYIARASMATPRRLRTVPKMAARLSMLGLPFSERCRLLLGRLVSAAKSRSRLRHSSKQSLTAFPVRYNLIDAPERANLHVERKIRLVIALSSRATTEAQREN